MTTLRIVLLCELEAILSIVILEAMQFHSIRNSALVTTFTGLVT